MVWRGAATKVTAVARPAGSRWTMRNSPRGSRESAVDTASPPSTAGRTERRKSSSSLMVVRASTNTSTASVIAGRSHRGR